MLDAVVDGFTDSIILAHAAFLILFRPAHEEAVLANRLTAFEKRAVLLVRDVDDVARKVEVRAFFPEVVGKAHVFLVFLHFLPDIERIEMRCGKVNGRPSIQGFLVRNGTEEQTLYVDKLAESDVRADRALVFREDDRLIFPCEGHVVFELVEQNVFERVDFNVFRADDFFRPEGLVEFRKLVAVVHEHAEDRILVLAVRHAVTSCLYFTMILDGLQEKYGSVLTATVMVAAKSYFYIYSFVKDETIEQSK